MAGGISMNCGIVIFPGKHVQDFANSYRKRYDPHYNLIQPHITIREKEQWQELQLTAAVDRLERVTQTVSPFELHFNRFSSFYPVNNVIYMALSNNEPIQTFYEAICTDVLEEKDKLYLYNPHLTIGQKMGDDELHDVLASLKKTEIDLTSQIDRVHLLYQTENEAWTVHQTFLLRG
jgi:2'-5' RNA ligase